MPESLERNTSKLKNKKLEDGAEDLGSRADNLLWEREEKRVWKTLLGWLLYLLVIIVLAYIINTFFVQRTKVIGHSMETTLSNKDQLIVEKISYRFREPSRYDIIVFPYKHEENTYYIKRIIGLPGETLQIMNGCVYIDGKPLESDVYGAEPMEEAMTAAEPITLGEDEYFVLGDNRNHSSDSRDPSVGVLKREDLVGRAWIRIYPFDKMGAIRHE